MCCTDFFVYTYNSNDVKSVQTLMKVIEFNMQHIHCHVLTIIVETETNDVYYCNTTIKTETSQCMQTMLDMISNAAGIYNVCYVPHPHICEKEWKYIRYPRVCLQWIHPNYHE